MRIRHAPWFAAAYTAIGLALIVTAMVTGAWEVIVPGAVLALIGALFFGPLPYLRISESAIRYALPVGIYQRAIGPKDRLYFDGNRLLLKRPREPRIVVGNRMFAHHGDWDRMAATIPERQPS
jgi:hypothetical protein